ncbi:MAG: sulfatase-like hydrolase/transferase, partial [Planctomycetota bacterium]
TGRYGFRTGWYHNNVKPASGEKGYILSDDNLIFAQVLKNAGYATAICGKWQLRGTQAEHGFAEHCVWKKTGAFDGPIEPPEGNLPGRAARYWHPAIVRNDVQLDTDDDDYGPNIFTDFALEFAEKHKDEPFLVYYPMVLPHLTWDFDLLVHGWVAPPEIDENDRWTGNKGEPTLKGNVEYIDYLVGRIVKGLEELGLRDNTIFMITGDNGTAGYGKSILYQEKGPRVTMVVNCPGTVEPIGASDALVDFTDIMATLVDISGARLPAGYVADGHSFAPILRNEKQHVREWIFSFFKDKRFLRDTRWLLDGDGTFWDTHGSRDEGLWGTVPYTDVTSSTDPEVVAAQAHFEQILQDLPAGPPA